MSPRSFRGVRLIRFGDFELDVRAAELRKDSRRIRLQEQPFRILAMLLEHPGEVVLREEIRRRLWPNDTIVEVAHGINAAVLRLREALGESAENPRYVETLARRGYRFVGPVEVVFKDQAEPVRLSPEPVTPAFQPAIAAAALDTSDLAGKTVSHYLVLEKLGGGGMGVVYRAEDLRLGRHVALKFLPQELARDPAALGRFQREARAASALNHPNICTVYGVEECAGQPVIIMELLEGETLEARLARGPLPLDKALALAILMAGALDAAHRKGVVHRDLKPSNVLVTKSGVKVLDFGLAKMERAIAAGSSAFGHVTESGVILGTLHYMSPEQVQGKDAGACSDIFSFGVVLYEMLTGRRAFDGDSFANVMAAILTAEPDAIREPTAPPALERVLRRCLAKDPEDRWQTARDLKAALEWIAVGQTPAPAPITASVPRLPAMPQAPSQPARKNWIMGAVFGTVFCALLFVAFSRGRETPSARWSPPISQPVTMTTAPSSERAILPSAPPPTLGSGQVTRFAISAPGNGAISYLSLAPDSRSIAFVASGRLYVRRLESLETNPVDGTPASGGPFWSPDGRFLAFISGGKLKTIAITGGPASTVCEVNTNLSGAWAPDGTILIGMVGNGLFRVPVTLGTLTRWTKLDASRDETRHLLPQFLPDGRRFLFVAGSNKVGESILYAGSLDSPERTPILRVTSGFAFVPLKRGSHQGYLLFARDHTLTAQPFDAMKLRATGEPVPIAGPVDSAPVIGASVQVAHFSASGETLAYKSSAQITVIQNWMATLQQ